jgi:iron complex transport system ATP-binding protein
MLTDRTKPELMTCHDIVAAGRYPYTGALGILSETDEKAIEDALELVHAREIAFRDFNAISDGQRQRVLLARALCQEPEIIVLDEPTSFLDIRHKLELLEILRHMAREQNITVILSLHEIDLAQKISDRVVCVKGDRIAGYGSAEEIFTEEKIRDLYELREGVYDPAFGSLELPGTEGDPRVFVLSGCGTGIPVFRSLKRQGIPFAAGILYTNDIDYRLARLTAAEVVSEQPFEEISDRALTQARQWVDRCGSVILTDFPIRSVNHRIEELINGNRIIRPSYRAVQPRREYVPLGKR